MKADNDNASSSEILNAVYKAAIDTRTPNENYSTRYRLSIARLRYGPHTPLDLYYKPRDEFVSAFGLEAYMSEHMGMDFDIPMPHVFEFEDRGDKIFTKGSPLFVTAVPADDGDDDEEDGWYWDIQTHATRSDADYAVGGVVAEEFKRAA